MRCLADGRRQGVYFVTRMKDNALYEVVGERKVPQNRNILKDELIELTGLRPWRNAPIRCDGSKSMIRKQEKILVFLTNHYGLGGHAPSPPSTKTVGRSKSSSKHLKQNLKIKTFVGTSANAVKIQIWTALIAMLILRFLQLRSQFHWSLSNLVALLRMNLFTHRDLWAWLNKPFDSLTDSL